MSRKEKIKWLLIIKKNIRNFICQRINLGMHIGSYDDEPSTINLMHEYMIENGYELDITNNRFHHEIYLSDPRRCDVNKLKTVVRHPIRKEEEYE